MNNLFTKQQAFYKKAGLIALILIFSLLFNIDNSQAVTVSELQKQQTELNKQIQDNRTKVKEAKAEITDISSQITELDSYISLSESKISELAIKVEDNKNQIKQTEENIVSKKRDLDNEMGNQAETLRTIYEAYKYSNPIRMIIGTSTLSQLINYNAYLEALENKIDATIAEINKIKTELENNKKTLEEKKKELEGLQEQEAAYKRGVEDQRYTKDKLLENKESEKASLEDQIEEAKAMQAEVEAKISSLMAASSKSGSGQTVYARDRGTSAVGFMWPADYQYISAYYGEVTPFQSFHSGIDLANISGTPIYATADGDVSTVASMQTDGHYYGYGNYLIIGHNARFASLYGHLTSFAVSQGDHVTKGQIIGYMGNTGWSTGPHLHFEIWESSDGGNNYARVNPISYLP